MQAKNNGIMKNRQLLIEQIEELILAPNQTAHYKALKIVDLFQSPTNNTIITDFIGEKVQFKKGSNHIDALKEGKLSSIVEISPYCWMEKISTMFKIDGCVNYNKAYEFQDKLCEWITEAINEKLMNERLK